MDYPLMNGSGPLIFCIKSKVYHVIGSLLPPNRFAERFNKIYINQSSAKEGDRRMSLMACSRT